MANRTKKLIKDSFRKLLSEKPLGEITVKDIVADCEINRKTFYYHFSDIYALADEIFLETIDELVRDTPAGADGWCEMVGRVAQCMADNRKITLHVYRTLGYERTNEVLRGICMKYASAFLLRASADLHVKKEDVDSLAHFYSIAVSAVLAQWMKEGLPDIPGMVVKRFECIMRGTVRNALENAASMSAPPKEQ